MSARPRSREERQASAREGRPVHPDEPSSGPRGWVLHPLDEELRTLTNGKLRAIPVRLLFNDPSLNLRADYSLFDREMG
nr:hypothetical protein [Cupriavidus metallidurans]